jgi:hypothetical protein
VTGDPNLLLPHRIEIDPAGPPAAARLPTHGGVYVLADAEGRTILTAACEDLRRAVSARLAAPHESRTRRARLGDVARSVLWAPTFSPFETHLRYLAVVRRLYPEDYRRRLGFAPAYFLRGHTREAIPRITAVTHYSDDGARLVGPFATRRDAEATIDVLNDVFDLCRKYDILRQAPHGRPCEYLEMGKCPAPCDGRVPMSDYQAAIGRAMSCAAGDRSAATAELERRMRQAAGEQQFERAAALHRTLERAEAHFRHPGLRFVRDLAEFQWLVVQRGGPRSRSPKRLLLKPFFVTRAGVAEGQPAPLDALESTGETWLERARQPPGAAKGDAAERSECIWCVTRFLFKGEDAAGLFYRADFLPNVDRLVRDARERFLKRAEEPASPVAPPAEGPAGPAT